MIGYIVLGAVSFFISLLCFFIWLIRSGVITGSIGSGKSTVVNLIHETDPDIVIIDSDKIAREILQPGESAYSEVVKEFGSEILVGAEIDRKKLAEIVFSDSSKRRVLNSITHWRVFCRIFARLIKARLTQRRVLIDMPLFFEVIPRNFRVLFNPIILVFCDERLKISRVMKRDRVDEVFVRKRLESQMSDSVKLPLAHILLENSGNIDQLRLKIANKLF